MRKIAVVGSGSPLSCAVTERLSEHADVRAVIVPDLPWRSRLRSTLGGGLPAAELRRIGKKAGAAVSSFSGAAKVLRDVDLIVIASFPRRVPAGLIARAPAINVHMSLLPRHRGPDPIFAAYWNDDRETGITIHYATAEIDAGWILAQQAVPLARGWPSHELYMSLTHRGADLVIRTVDAACERVHGSPQDDRQAVRHSARDLAAATVPFASWSAERVWHVLSGLGDQRTRLVADSSGARLAHGRASAFRLGPSDPGRVEQRPASWLLHAADGIVELLRR